MPAVPTLAEPCGPRTQSWSLPPLPPSWEWARGSFLEGTETRARRLAWRPSGSNERGRGRGVRTCFRSRGAETARVLGSLRRHLRLGKGPVFCRSHGTASEGDGRGTPTWLLSAPQFSFIFSPPWTLCRGAPQPPDRLSPLGLILSVCKHDTALDVHPFPAGFFLHASQTTVTLTKLLGLSVGDEQRWIYSV